MSTPTRRKPVVILERPLNKSKGELVSLSSYLFLFSEMIQYTQKQSVGIEELEKKLAEIGYRVGIRYLELLWIRNGLKRETKLLQMLIFINSTFWKALFGKQADSLEKGTDNEDEYMISDNEPLITKMISVPKEMSSLNCGAFIAGMIEAILDATGFVFK